MFLWNPAAGNADRGGFPVSASWFQMPHVPFARQKKNPGKGIQGKTKKGKAGQFQAREFEVRKGKAKQGNSRQYNSRLG